MFGRKIQDHIPQWSNKINENMQSELQENDEISRFQSRIYSNDRMKATHRELHLNDHVLIKQDKHNKLTQNSTLHHI